jgi:hypothetical protein
MIHFLTCASDDWTVREYLSRWGRPVAERIRIVHYEKLFHEMNVERGTYVFSGLCRLTDDARDFLRGLHERLDAVGGFRLLNHPTHTLRRLGLLEELARLGWNAFRAVRATGDFAGLRYPVFLRAERTHEGALSPLLHSRREVEAAIGRASLGGRDPRDLLVVEFCDTADSAGYYRKYSAYVVGDRILPRSVERGHAWMLKHSGSDFTREILEEERSYVVGNPHRAQLAQIFSVARTEYGRIDYAVRDGRVQTWEINLHPTIGRGRTESSDLVPPDLKPFREETKSIFHRGFQEAWAAVDLPPDGRGHVAISAADRRRGAPSRPVFPSAHARAWRRALRPLRRFGETIATPLLPWVGRAALRRARPRTSPPSGVRP